MCLCVGHTARCFRSFFLLLHGGLKLSPSPARLFHRGAGSVVPSEDYSHGPPRWPRFVGEGRQSEAEQQLETKKKTMKTNKQNNNTNTKTQASTQTNSGLKNRSEQRVETETAKDNGKDKDQTEKAATVNAPVRPYVNFAERAAGIR